MIEFTMRMPNIIKGDLVAIVVKSKSCYMHEWKLMRVERTTNNQFIVDGKRFSKLNGKEIGGTYPEYMAALPNDTAITKITEAVNTRRKKELIDKVKNKIEAINLRDLDIAKLEDLLTVL